MMSGVGVGRGEFQNGNEEGRDRARGKMKRSGRPHGGNYREIIAHQY
jgi:hypothetical protein